MYDLTYLSLGAGVQSTALLAMSCRGDYGVPKIDFAVFADTQSEIKDTYDHLDYLEKWAAPYGVKIIRVTLGSLEKSCLMKEAAPGRNEDYFISIPLFTLGAGGKKEGRLRRQCTREFKVQVIEKEIRNQLGFEKGERIAGKKTALGLIGISMDEVVRVKPSRVAWIEHKHPLVDSRLSRVHCLKYLDEVGIPRPQKSACYFCPYHDDEFWYWLKTERSQEWERAVAFDQAIRNMTRAGVERPVFIHRDCFPLKDIDLAKKAQERKEAREFAKHQLTLWDNPFVEECEGMCGV